MKLWQCPDTRSFRVLWALEELGLPYELHLLPFPPRAQASDYLTISPLGTIPAFRDGQTFMTESVASVQYLVNRHQPNPLAVPESNPVHGAWLNWLYFSDSTAAKAVLTKHAPTLTEPGPIEHARPMTLKALQQYMPTLTDELLAKIDADLALIK